jgi:hypothetical protein
MTNRSTTVQVAHHLDEADELAFVGGELGVLRCDLTAEERDWPTILGKN